MAFNHLISIIIPVYNVEPWLDECLESVVGQTYENLEIIIVNDGSTDSSGEICEKWANKGSRIKLFIQENAGLSAARNAGLRNAIGDYYLFVDSDDYIEPNMAACLYDALGVQNFGEQEAIYAEEIDRLNRLFQYLVLLSK